MAPHTHWKTSNNGNDFILTVTGGRFTVLAETPEGPVLLMHENFDTPKECKAYAERLVLLVAIDRLRQRRDDDDEPPPALAVAA
jgi:hypothetical protein